jgi:hypothetical protein
MHGGVYGTRKRATRPSFFYSKCDFCIYFDIEPYVGDAAAAVAAETL